MSMESWLQTDFSGGLAERQVASDFGENQSAAITGMVLDRPEVLRSQWHLASPAIGHAIVDMGFTDDHLVFKNTLGDWYWAAEPALDAGGPLTATLLHSAPEQDVLGEIPFRLVGSTWVNALMTNSVDRAGEAALYYDAAGTPVRFQFTDSYPTDGSADAMPRAAVSTMWGDYLLLGDIQWRQDPDVSFAAANAQRYPHGLWFSKPGEPTRWEDDSVEFVGQASGDNNIVGMFPVDIGLIVVTTSAITVLRGGPTSHSFEQLRRGVSPTSKDAVCWWPSLGIVAWVDHAGRVWHTDGREVKRLDGPLSDVDSGAGAVVVAQDHHLLVSRGDIQYCLTMQVDGSGAWTVLSAGAATSRAVERPSGTWWLDGTTLRRWSPRWGARGFLDVTAVTQTFRSQPVEIEDGHQNTWWHSFGVRATGGSAGGQLNGAAVFQDGTSVWSTGVVTPLSTLGSDVRWPAGGPARTFAVQLDLEGDVILDQLAIWFHGGQARR